MLGLEAFSCFFILLLCFIVIAHHPAPDAAQLQFSELSLPKLGMGVVVAIQLIGGGLLVGFAAVHAIYGLFIPGAVMLAIGGMLMWVLRGTSYEITETRLIIRSGPIRWTISLDAIEDVVPAANWKSGMNSS